MPSADNPFLESARLLGHYIKAQVLISAIDMVLYAIGYAIAGLPLWPVVAVLSGLCYVIPQVGGLLAIGIAALAGLFGELDLTRWLIVLATWVAVQAIEGFVLTPRILGKRLGLPPLLVFAGLIVAGLFLGPIGLLVAVPVLGIGNIFWRYYRRQRADGKG